MIKSELVSKIAERTPHLGNGDVGNIVTAILDTIADALARGDRVELRGFGAFSVKRRDARTARNPRRPRDQEAYSSCTLQLAIHHVVNVHGAAYFK